MVATTDHDDGSGPWLTWMLVTVIVLFTFLLVAINASATDAANGVLWFGAVIGGVIAALVLPAWAVWGLAGGEEH